MIPYYGYAARDRKDKPRVPISAKLVANILSCSASIACSRWICTRRRFRWFFDISGGSLFAARSSSISWRVRTFRHLTMGRAPMAAGRTREGVCQALDGELAVIDQRRQRWTAPQR